MLELSNAELYERMVTYKAWLVGILAGSTDEGRASREQKAREDLQQQDFCKELRRRAEANPEFASTIPAELLPAVFPEQFWGGR